MSDPCKTCGKPKCVVDDECFDCRNGFARDGSRCHGHADEAQPTKPPAETCPDCAHPAHRKACGWYNLAASVPRERYCSCETRTPVMSKSMAKRIATQKGESMPVEEESVDLTTELIEYLCWPTAGNFYFAKEQRDEIVTALRLLRVLRHPRCDKGYFTGTSKLVFRLDGTPARRLLDDTERILFGGGGR